MSAPHPALASLRENVDRFMEACLGRHRAVMACSEGCAACCDADLSVFPVEAAPLVAAVEALPEEVREAVRARARADQRCALLINDRCAVYEQRPIICRTQGLALRLDDDSVTACPLNFGGAPEEIPAADHLDLTRLNTMLAVLHHASPGDGERVRLADIALSPSS